MKIALVYTHHKRCGPHYYRKAFRRLGHEVFSVGPWYADEPWGVRGTEPDFMLPARQPWHYPWADILLAPWPWKPDLFVLIEGGEDLRVVNIPKGIPWVHISTEGSHMEWSRGLTPYRYSEIMCNIDAIDWSVEWLPKAFDSDLGQGDTGWPLPGGRLREYDLVQLATKRVARQAVWDYVRDAAPDLNCVFGELYGPIYETAYGNALATYVCTTSDFITNRVFEAMAMGCVVIADRQPSYAKLGLIEGEHYIGYDGVPGPGGENMPPVDWLIETVRNLRQNGDRGIALRAWKEVTDRHSFDVRCKQVLQAVFG